MADTTATAHVFPSANDVRGSLAAGWGKTMYESNVGSYLANILSQGNYVQSGFALPASSASLSITVPSGVAMIYGHYVAVDSQAITVGASVTTFLYLKLLLDANSNVSSVAYETNTTGTAPSYSVLIGKIVSGVGTITSTNQDGMPFGVSHPTKGPIRIGSGSTISLETFTSATGNLSGVHFYDGNFTLSSAHTLTIPAGSGRLIIVANGIITISGTISGSGGGLLGGGSGGADSGSAGSGGTDQVAGGGGGGVGTMTNAGAAGGGVIIHGLTIQGGGAGAATGGTGTAGSQLAGSSAMLHDLFSHYGGASGGGGGGNDVTAGGAGGYGGASIILIAPAVFLASTAVLNTSGSAGSAGPGGGRGGGGGGGAGAIIIATRSYTDAGATFTQTGGAGGAGGGGGAGAGGAGAAGVKQINIY